MQVASSVGYLCYCIFRIISFSYCCFLITVWHLWILYSVIFNFQTVNLLLLRNIFPLLCNCWFKVWNFWLVIPKKKKKLFMYLSFVYKCIIILCVRLFPFSLFLPCTGLEEFCGPVLQECDPLQAFLWPRARPIRFTLTATATPCPERLRPKCLAAACLGRQNYRLI